MPSRLSIACRAATIPALLWATVPSLPALAAVYSARCQFNDQAPMPCVVHAKPVPFGWTIQWQDGVVESYAHVGDGSALRDARGGLWRRSGDDQQELLRHANGNRIRIDYLP